MIHYLHHYTIHYCHSIHYRHSIHTNHMILWIQSLPKIRLTHWTEPRFLDGVLESLSWAAFWQGRRWRTALRRLRADLEGENGVVERIAVAGGNRYATGIP